MFAREDDGLDQGVVRGMKRKDRPPKDLKPQADHQPKTCRPLIKEAREGRSHL